MNVLELIKRHGMNPKKKASTKGGEYACACPGCGGVDHHGDPSDRFRIWPEENDGDGSYWCRRCGKGGDAIQFLRDFEGLTFRQACERLGRQIPDSADYRLRHPSKAITQDWTPREPIDPEAAWREHAAKLVKYAVDMLERNEEQLDWLESRGISVAAAAHFKLGWLPEVFFKERKSWGLAEVINEKTGKPRTLALPRGLVIPWFTCGDVVKIRIRRPDAGTKWPRYYVIPGSNSATTLIRPQRHDLVPRDVYVVVESDLDAYTMASQAGDIVGAVALGSNSAHPDKEAAAILANSAVILNALDFDEAGATQRAWWEKHYPKSKRWPVPEGKDPGEAYKAGVNLRGWVLAGLPKGLR